MIWILGNGESRSSIDVDKLHSMKIGCNAIFRDFNIEKIVCVDRRMVNEAVLASKSIIYTRKDWVDQYKGFSNVFTVPDLPYNGTARHDEPFNWGSGPYALLIGAQESNDCRMLGFDLYGIDKKVNNIYKSTQGYDNEDKRAVDPRYWIAQMSKIFQLYPYKKFTIYNYPGWILPESWNQPNVKVDNISNISYTA